MNYDRIIIIILTLKNGIIFEVEKRIDTVPLFCSYSWQELDLTKSDGRCRKSKTTFKKSQLLTCHSLPIKSCIPE